VVLGVGMFAQASTSTFVTAPWINGR